MNKKMFSILIIVLLVVSSTNTAFAQNSYKCKSMDSDKTSMQVAKLMPLNAKKYDKETLEMLLLAFTKYGFVINKIAENDVGDLVVNLQNGRLKSYVNIKCARQDKLDMISTEGDVSNNAVIQDNGEIIIDGENIMFYEKVNPEAEVRANAFQDRYQLACPYGTAQDYTKYYRTIRNSNVSFSTSVKNITTLLCAVMIGRIIPGFDFLFGLSYEIAGLIKKYDPYSTAASFVTSEYFHKRGYFVNNMIAVKRCISTIYTDTNYKGFIFTRIFYFVHEFNM